LNNKIQKEKEMKFGKQKSEYSHSNIEDNDDLENISFGNLSTFGFKKKLRSAFEYMSNSSLFIIHKDTAARKFLIKLTTR
jgi:hypothetical protein